jgi:hypothetical protein
MTNKINRISFYKNITFEESYIFWFYTHRDAHHREIEIFDQNLFDLFKNPKNIDYFKNFMVQEQRIRASKNGQVRCFEQLCIRLIEFRVRRVLFTEISFEEGETMTPHCEKDFKKEVLSFERTSHCPKESEDPFQCD